MPTDPRAIVLGSRLTDKSRTRLARFTTVNVPTDTQRTKRERVASELSFSSPVSPSSQRRSTPFRGKEPRPSQHLQAFAWSPNEMQSPNDFTLGIISIPKVHAVSHVSNDTSIPQFSLSLTQTQSSQCPKNFLLDFEHWKHPEGSRESTKVSDTQLPPFWWI